MPSNLALIKYMGKQTGNTACNPSLSYTLGQLTSSVRLEPDEQHHLVTDVTLKPGGEQAFLEHAIFLCKNWQITERFRIESKNNFPSGCGLASSASSYAALTEALYQWAHQHHGLTLTPLKKAQMARQGSGSACRSFFSPYALWQGDQITALGEDWPDWHHEVLLLDHTHKSISSSQAHQRVKTSRHWSTRQAALTERLSAMQQALITRQWRDIYALCKQEFLCMHELFHQCQPAFSYWHADTEAIIQRCDRYADEGLHFLISMDAGANLHFLIDPAQQSDFQKVKQDLADYPWWQA